MEYGLIYCIEYSPNEKDLRMWVNEKFDLSQKRVCTSQKASHILGFIKRFVTSRAREVILPLCSCETPLGILSSALGLPPQGHGTIRTSLWPSSELGQEAGAALL